MQFPKPNTCYRFLVGSILILSALAHAEPPTNVIEPIREGAKIEAAVNRARALTVEIRRSLETLGARTDENASFILNGSFHSSSAFGFGSGSGSIHGEGRSRQAREFYLVRVIPHYNEILELIEFEDKAEKKAIDRCDTIQKSQTEYVSANLSLCRSSERFYILLKTWLGEYKGKDLLKKAGISTEQFKKDLLDKRAELGKLLDSLGVTPLSSAQSDLVEKMTDRASNIEILVEELVIENFERIKHVVVESTTTTVKTKKVTHFINHRAYENFQANQKESALHDSDSHNIGSRDFNTYDEHVGETYWYDSQVKTNSYGIFIY